MLNRFVFVYLDDILIFSKSKQEHIHQVRQVLQGLLENQLYVKAEQYEVHVTQVSFLGFIVASESIQMDPAKVSAVSNWSRPENRKQFQHFLGFANFYRRFIRNGSTVAAPLRELTSPRATYQWTLAVEKAFSQLEQSFCTAPVLILPGQDSQFIVEVDASDVGVGAVRSQRSVSNDKIHPCTLFFLDVWPQPNVIMMLTTENS